MTLYTDFVWHKNEWHLERMGNTSAENYGCGCGIGMRAQLQLSKLVTIALKNRGLRRCF